jgi:hypothetical protein
LATEESNPSAQGNGQNDNVDANGVVIGPGGSACEQADSCEKIDDPGNDGNLDVPDGTDTIVIKAGQNYVEITIPDEGEVCQGGYCLVVDENGNLSYYTQEGSKDISHIQMWDIEDDPDPTEEPEPTETPTEVPTEEPTDEPTPTPTEPSDDCETDGPNRPGMGDENGNGCPPPCPNGNGAYHGEPDCPTQEPSETPTEPTPTDTPTETPEPTETPTEEPEKVDVCHIPPGNPENAHVINISINALDAHLAHGDVQGSCPGGTETPEPTETPTEEPTPEPCPIEGLGNLPTDHDDCVEPPVICEDPDAPNYGEEGECEEPPEVCEWNPDIPADSDECFEPCEFDPTMPADDPLCVEPPEECPYDSSLTIDDPGCVPPPPPTQQCIASDGDWSAGSGVPSNQYSIGPNGPVELGMGTDTVDQVDGSNQTVFVQCFCPTVDNPTPPTQTTYIFNDGQYNIPDGYTDVTNGYANSWFNLAEAPEGTTVWAQDVFNSNCPAPPQPPSEPPSEEPPAAPPEQPAPVPQPVEPEPEPEEVVTLPSPPEPGEELITYDVEFSPKEVITRIPVWIEDENGEVRVIGVDPYIASSCVGGNSEHPTFTLSTEMVVFSNDIDGDYDLMVSASRGQYVPNTINRFDEDCHQLSDTPNRHEIHSDVLNTGEISFAGCELDFTNCEIIVTDLRGTEAFERGLGVYGYYPDGKPIGNDIVYTDEQTGQLCIVSRFGEMIKNYCLYTASERLEDGTLVPGEPVYGIRPRWNSSGTEISFFSANQQEKGEFIYNMAEKTVVKEDNTTTDVAANPNHREVGAMEIGGATGWIFWDPEGGSIRRNPLIEESDTANISGSWVIIAGEGDIANPDWSRRPDPEKEPAEAADAAAFANAVRTESAEGFVRPGLEDQEAGTEVSSTEFTPQETAAQVPNPAEISNTLVPEQGDNWWVILRGFGIEDNQEIQQIITTYHLDQIRVLAGMELTLPSELVNYLEAQGQVAIAPVGG